MPLHFHSIALFALLQLTLAAADIDYAVYFDPSRDNRNPLQRSGSFTDYDPKGPGDWSKVDREAFPIFTNWGEVLDEPGPWYSRGNKHGNECEDRTDASYDSRHRQSPIMLMESDVCNDRHKMINEEKGVCEEDEIDFYTTPYGLGAKINCSVQPLLDHSLNDDIWTLEEIVIKTPGEHSIWNYETNQEDTYVGEIQLGYKGSQGEFETGLEGHAENIAIVGILLQVDEDAKRNKELEKLIRGWEKYQEDRYDSCDVDYNESDCSLFSRGRKPNDEDNPNGDDEDENEGKSTLDDEILDKDADDESLGQDVDSENVDKTIDDESLDKDVEDENVIEECREDCAKCCKVRERNLQYSDKMPETSSFPVSQKNLQNLVQKQKEEIEKLKEELGRCNASFPDAVISSEPNQHRELGYWNRKCEGFYCLLNLFKNTETDYYYNYRGGLTYPPCTEIVYWRVMMEPLIISPDQLERIERLIYMHLNEDCELDTVGKRREGGDTCAVDVNRPRQALSRRHKLKKCDSWNTAGAFADFGDEYYDEDEDEDEWSTGGSSWARAASVFVEASEKSKSKKKDKKKKSRLSGTR